MIGIRLDSGDLASLSIEARRILDEGGFPQAAIVASNDLDERIVETLKEQGRQDQRLGRRHAPGHRLRRSGPGRRLQALGHSPAGRGLAIQGQALRADGQGFHAGRLAGPPLLLPAACPLADAIIDENAPCDGRVTIVDPLDMTRRKTVPDGVRQRGPAGARVSRRAAGVRRARSGIDSPPRRGAARQFSRRRSSASSIRTSISSAWSAACTSARRGSSCRNAGSSGDTNPKRSEEH